MTNYARAADYINGPLYTKYEKFPFFAQRADWIVNRWPQVVGTNKVAILGCGPGAYLVEELFNRGVNCYGLDAYEKDVNHGFTDFQLTPTIASRCILDADASNNSDVARFTGKNYLNLKGQEKVYLSVTDDMLGCLTTQQASTTVSILQSKSTNVLHIITCNTSPTGTDPHRYTGSGLLWLTQSAWRQLINAAGGTSHICLNTETWETF